MFVQYRRRRLLAVISWESSSKGGTLRYLVISSLSTQDIDATFSTKNLRSKTQITIEIKTDEDKRIPL